MDRSRAKFRYPEATFHNRIAVLSESDSDDCTPLFVQFKKLNEFLDASVFWDKWSCIQALLNLLFGSDLCFQFSGLNKKYDVII